MTERRFSEYADDYNRIMSLVEAFGAAAREAGRAPLGSTVEHEATSKAHEAVVQAVLAALAGGQS